MKKRILSFLLALVMVFGMIPDMALAAPGTDYTWDDSTKTLTLLTQDGVFEVAAWKDSLGFSRDDVEMLVVGDGLLIPYDGVYEDSMFMDADNLKEVTFLGTSTLERMAFYNCDALETVTFKGNADFAEFYAFSECENLKTVTFEAAANIRDYNFQDCPNLDTVTFGGKADIGEEAFDECEMLKTVTFAVAPAIGSRAFYQAGKNLADGMDPIVFPAGTTFSGERNFAYSGATEVTFMGDVDITYLTFTGNKKLTKVEFKGKSNFTNLYGFDDCDYLKTVIFGGPTTMYEYAFHGSGDKAVGGMDPIVFPAGSTFGGENFVASGVTSITYEGDVVVPYGEFESAHSLSSVTFLGAAKIEKNAFSDCDALKTVTFTQAPVIGDYAFGPYSTSSSPIKKTGISTGMDPIVFPAGTVFGEGSFAYANVTKITFAGDVVLPASCFYECDLLTEATFLGDAELDYQALRFCDDLETVTFHGVTSLGSMAVYNYDNGGSNAAVPVEVHFLSLTPGTYVNWSLKYTVDGSKIYVPCTAYEAYIAAFNEDGAKDQSQPVLMSHVYDNAEDTECNRCGNSKVQPTAYTIKVNKGWASPSGKQDAGSIIMVSASYADTGMRFKEWQGIEGLTLTSGSKTTPVIQFVMPDADVELTAVYEEIPDESLVYWDGVGLVDGKYYAIDDSTHAVKVNDPLDAAPASGDYFLYTVDTNGDAQIEMFGGDDVTVNGAAGDRLVHFKTDLTIVNKGGDLILNSALHTGFFDAADPGTNDRYNVTITSAGKVELISTAANGSYTLFGGWMGNVSITGPDGVKLQTVDMGLLSGYGLVITASNGEISLSGGYVSVYKNALTLEAKGDITADGYIYASTSDVDVIMTSHEGDIILENDVSDCIEGKNITLKANDIILKATYTSSSGYSSYSLDCYNGTLTMDASGKVELLGTCSAKTMDIKAAGDITVNGKLCVESDGTGGTVISENGKIRVVAERNPVYATGTFKMQAGDTIEIESLVKNSSETVLTTDDDWTDVELIAPNGIIIKSNYDLIYRYAAYSNGSFTAKASNGPILLDGCINAYNMDIEAKDDVTINYYVHGYTKEGVDTHISIKSTEGSVILGNSTSTYALSSGGESCTTVVEAGKDILLRGYLNTKATLKAKENVTIQGIGSSYAYYYGVDIISSSALLYGNYVISYYPLQYQNINGKSYHVLKGDIVDTLSRKALLAGDVVYNETEQYDYKVLKIEEAELSGGTTIKVMKVDDDGNALPGASFELSQKIDGEIGYSAVSDASGIATFENIPDGEEYYLWESEAPAGYAASDDVYILNIEDGDAVYASEETPEDTQEYDNADPLVFDNKLYKTSFFLTKTDEFGKELAGATFKLTSTAENGPVYTATSDAEGKAWFIDVVDGDYIMTEEEAPQYYTKSDKTHAFTITEGKVYYITYEVIHNLYRNTLKVVNTVDKYDVWVLGTQVTKVNETDVLGDGMVSYDPTTNTLTISRDLAAINNVTAIRATTSEPLTIEVDGDYTISAVSGNAIYTANGAVITADGNVTITSANTSGNPTVVGDLTISAVGKNVALSHSGAGAIIQSESDLTVTAANTVTATGNTAGPLLGVEVDITAAGNVSITNNSGFICRGALKVAGADVTVTGTLAGPLMYGAVIDATGDVQMTNTNGFIISSEKKLEIKNAKDVILTATGNGPAFGKDPEINATGDVSITNHNGFICLGMLKVAGADVTVTGTLAGPLMYGAEIDATGDVEMTNGNANGQITSSSTALEIVADSVLLKGAPVSNNPSETSFSYENVKDAAYAVLEGASESALSVVSYKASGEAYSSDMDVNVIQIIPGYTAPGTIRVLKVDENGEPLAGATITMSRRIDGVPGYTAVSDANGIATFTNIPDGAEYYIWETEAPAGYQLSSDTYMLNMEGGVGNYTVEPSDENPTGVVEYDNNNPFVITNELYKMDLSVKKADNYQQPVEGAQFKLESVVAGGPAYEATSDADGLVTFEDVVDGEYILSEISAPATHIKSEDTYKFKVENGEAYLYDPQRGEYPSRAYAGSLWIINTKIPTAVFGLSKTDALGNPLAGAVFHLTEEGKSEPAYEAISDAQGIVSFEVVAGTYILSEYTAPDGYEKSTETYKFMVDPTENDPHNVVKLYAEEGYVGYENTLVIENEMEPVTIEIPVTKVVTKGANTDFVGSEVFTFEAEVLDSNVQNNALAITGNTITVTNMNGGNTIIQITVPGEKFSNVISEGILIREVANGSAGWTYDETEWVALYDEETGWKFAPYDEAFGPVEPEYQSAVTFTNTYTKFTPVDIVIKKTDDAGEPLADAQFILENDSNEYTATSDANGLVIFEVDQPGYYTLSEVEAPEGYIMNEGTWYFNVYEDGRVNSFSRELPNGFAYNNEQPLEIENEKIVPVTIEIPVTKVVEKGSNTDFAGEVIFEFVIEVLNGNADAEVVDITGNTITVTDMTGGNTTIVITVPSNLVDDVISEGFRITEVTGEAEGWTYSEESYLVVPADTGWTYFLEGETEDTEVDEIVFTNTYTEFTPVNIVIKKTDDAGKELAGAVFHLTENGTSEPAYEAISGADGLVIFEGVVEGYYTLSEMSAPDGHIKSAETYGFSVDAQGNVRFFGFAGSNGEAYENGSLEIENEKIVPITIEIPVTKVVNKGANTDFAGEEIFEFVVESLNQNASEDAWSVTNNTITVTDMNGGSTTIVITIPSNILDDVACEGFRITEVSGTAEGWTYSEESYLAVPTDAGWEYFLEGETENTKADAIAFTNTYTEFTPVEIVVKKTDDAGNALAGAQFMLVSDSNEYPATSDADGLVTFTVDQPGYYTLSEVEAPEGYFKSVETYGFSVDIQGNVRFFGFAGSNGVAYENGALEIENEKIVPGIIRIPVNKEVVQGGNTEFAGEETFEFVIEVLNSAVDLELLEITDDSITVVDMTGGNTVIEITVPGEIYDDVKAEGIMITEVAGSSMGWSYDETQWIAVYDEEAGWKFVPYEDLFGTVEPEYQDHVTFANTYTEFVPVTIRIPVSKVVKKGGNTNFSGKETFRFAVEVLNSNVNTEMVAIVGDTVVVTDKNGQDTVITITVPGELFDDIIEEGFLITEVKGTAKYWSYDETQWIAVYDGETGWKFAPYDEEEPEFRDKVTFTNIYTKNVEKPEKEESKPSTPAVNPQNPPTGDNSHMGLWISLMFASMLCAAAVVFRKKRFSVK